MIAQTSASPMPVLPLVGSTTMSPGLERPLALRLLDHAEADAVLDAAAGIGDLELRPDLGAIRRRHAVQAHDRRVADEIERRIGDELGRGMRGMLPDRSGTLKPWAIELPDRDMRAGGSDEGASVVLFPGALGDAVCLEPAMAHLAACGPTTLYARGHAAEVAQSFPSLPTHPLARCARDRALVCATGERGRSRLARWLQPRRELHRGGGSGSRATSSFQRTSHHRSLSA